MAASRESPSLVSRVCYWSRGDDLKIIVESQNKDSGGIIVSELDGRCCQHSGVHVLTVGCPPAPAVLAPGSSTWHIPEPRFTLSVLFARFWAINSSARSSARVMNISVRLKLCVD